MRVQPVRPLLLFAAAFFLQGTPAQAQREGYTYLSYVGSDVSLVSRGEDDSTARPNTPVLSGDRLATGVSSRAEVVLADGAVVRVDARTNLRFDRLAKTWEADDERTMLYVERGALSIEVRSSTSSGPSPRIDTDDATVTVLERALVRVDATRRGTEVYVSEGRVEVATRAARVWVGAGEYLFASGEDQPEVANGVMPRDRFTRFVEERRDAAASAGEGVRHVSADYSYDYAASQLDAYGSWVWAASYGTYCWRPVAAADWAPYTSGYWRWTPGGLTWVGYEPWGWLPYHYGSWAFDASFGWCWLPGSSYSPAWVYWSYQPGWVGWCPIGYYSGYSPYWKGGWIGWRGGSRYPHLRGPVDLSRIDRRGWSFVTVGSMGGRFDARHVVRGDRLDLRSVGNIGHVATQPLRIDRGRRGSAGDAIRDAIRSVPVTAGNRADGRGGGIDDGLTAILRRDGSLSAQARNQLRDSWTRTGRDTGYRPTTPEGLFSSRRSEPSPGAPVSSEPGPVRRGNFSTPTGSGRSNGMLSRGTGRLDGGLATPIPSETWRMSGSLRPVVPNGLHRGSSLSSSQRPATSSPRIQEPRGATSRGDNGWRSSVQPRTAAESPRGGGQVRGGSGRSSAPVPQVHEPRQYSGGSSYRSSPPSSAPSTPGPYRSYSTPSSGSPSRSVSPPSSAPAPSAPSRGGGGSAPSTGGWSRRG